MPTASRKKKSGCLIAFLIIGGLGIGLVVILAIIGSLFPPPKPTNYTSSQTAPAAPQVSDVTWSQIVAIYGLQSKETDLARDEKWKALKGSTVQWSGTVVEASKDFLGNYILSVKMEQATLTFDVSVKLRSDQGTAALNLKKGDKVTYQARLVSWGTLLPITADEGVIVH